MFGIQQYNENGVSIDCNLSSAYRHEVECQLSSVSSFFIAAESQFFVFGITELIVCILLLLVMMVVIIWPFISQYMVNYLPLAAFNFFETTNWSRLYKKENQSITSSLLSNVA